MGCFFLVLQSYVCLFWLSFICHSESIWQSLLSISFLLLPSNETFFTFFLASPLCHRNGTFFFEFHFLTLPCLSDVQESRPPLFISNSLSSLTRELQLNSTLKFSPRVSLIWLLLVEAGLCRFVFLPPITFPRTPFSSTMFELSAFPFLTSRCQLCLPSFPFALPGINTLVHRTHLWLFKLPFDPFISIVWRSL